MRSRMDGFAKAICQSPEIPSLARTFGSAGETAFDMGGITRRRCLQSLALEYFVPGRNERGGSARLRLELAGPEPKELNARI
ncbi:hypothetical protein DXU06_44780 [Bradyrhizobium elkanii]